MRKKKRPGTLPIDIFAYREEESNDAHLFILNGKRSHITDSGPGNCWCECEVIKVLRAEDKTIWRVFVHAPLKSKEILDAEFVTIKGESNGYKS